MTITIRARPDFTLTPNDLPDMELDAVRELTFSLGAGLGASTLSDFTITSPNLTFGTVNVSGALATVTVTGSREGTHQIKTTATLDPTESVVNVLRLNVVDTTREAGGRDYG